MRSLFNLILITSLFTFLTLIFLPPATLDHTQNARAASHQLNSTANTPPCLVYPTVVHTDTISGKTPGVDKVDIFDGYGPIHFGWVSWNPDNAIGAIATSYLRDELRRAQLSLNDFTNARDPNDHILDVADYVASLPGDKDAPT